MKYVNDRYNELGKAVINVPYEIDEQVARFKLDSLGIQIDTLTEDQTSI